MFLIWKNSDLHLRKIHISFWLKKKFKYASKEDANQFLILKNSYMHLRKTQISFYFEKFRFTSKEDANQFYGFWKRCNDNQIFETKKIDHDNKSIKNIFQQKKNWPYKLRVLEIKTKRRFTHATSK